MSVSVHPHLVREDAVRLRVSNPDGIDVSLFARSDVPIEAVAVDEIRRVLEVQRTIDRLAALPQRFFGDEDPRIERVVLTPDFHKGAGIPIGTVIQARGCLIPQAIGNDVNCGMRVHLTSYTADDILRHRDEIERAFRHAFFQGGRDLPMTPDQRRALLCDGLSGLFDSIAGHRACGLWAYARDLGLDADLDRVDRSGSLPAPDADGLEDFIGQRRDGQIGSIGGGNHFVELQVVDRIIDGATAHAWGIHAGQVIVMVHTGSVMIGHLCGRRSRARVRSIHPDGIEHPSNGIHVLPIRGPHESVVASIRNALHNAANFAFGNRMCLAVMALRGLADVCGDRSSELLYDAPHNMVWAEDGNAGTTAIHRKGACPARGYEQMAGTPFAYTGEPVFVPGSMGASSFILAGEGNAAALHSASHGAGRQLSRGAAMKEPDEAFHAFLDRFRVVTALDLDSTELRMRPDIVAKRLADLKKEAPFAYKGIGPVVQTLEDARMARPVAEVTPLMTVKG